MPNLTQIREVFNRALDTAPEQREALLAEIPADVREEALQLLAAHESAGTFLNPSDGASIRDGQRIGPYLLIENIGVGGMGTVYRARRDDGQFHREVAIKLVGGSLFAPEAERRFIEERRILALFDHPHIVRMFDGGVWEGHRYLVMELVAGEPVTEYCDRNAVGLSEKLRLFQSICSAMHYAHQHLVIHRDLKPRNILVTAAGQVKVLDFGIARLLDESNPAETALNPMTLACASPEQVKGECLTMATDVYSLGLLLYELLTGVNPQGTGTRQEIEHRIVAGAPLPPSKVKARLPEDLDLIVLKALAKEPRSRYGSADAMSADIARCLEGQPVLARAPSRLYHATRFCLRNKALTAAVAVLVLAILAGSGVSLWQARRAEQQRVIAQRRFDEARRLTNAVIHEIQPELANINGTLTLRKTLIEKTLAYLEAVAKDATDSPTLLRELIDGYVELAGVSGAAGQASVGDINGAAQILRKGQALADLLNRVEPSTPDSQRTLSNFYRAFAHHAANYGQREMAIQYARKAMVAADKLVAIRGDDSSLEMAALSAATLGGVVPAGQEQIALYERAQGIWRAALEKNGSNAPKLRANIALMYRNISSSWALLDHLPEALESAGKARDLDVELLKQDPSSPALQMNLAMDLTAIGSAYSDMGKYAPAIDYQRQGIALREQVAAANPADRRAAERLAYAVYILAVAEQRQGNHAATLRDFERVAGVYGGLKKTAPLTSQSLLNFARSSYWIGRFETEAGHRSEGCRSFRRALSLAEEYNLKEPAQPMVEEDRAAVQSCAH